MDDSLNNLIPVGRIAGTHGIRGQIRFHSYSGNLESLRKAKDALLSFPDGKSCQVLIKQAVNHSGKILLTLDGFTEINQSALLIGSELFLRRDQFPPTEPDEYYWNDLLGLKVLTNEGIFLGIIKDIMETGANDVYLVYNENSKHEYLIPAIDDVISIVDLPSGTMTITPLEGLLDL